MDAEERLRRIVAARSAVHELDMELRIAKEKLQQSEAYERVHDLKQDKKAAEWELELELGQANLELQPRLMMRASNGREVHTTSEAFDLAVHTVLGHAQTRV